MKVITCNTCFDRATTLRKGKPSCRACMRLSPMKWEAALIEAKRIETSRSQVKKVA